MGETRDPSHPEHSTETTWDVTPPLSTPTSSTNLFESHDFNPGDTIAGRYRIVAVLGKGGMGEVYRADDLTLGTSVALKFLPPEFVADPVRLGRFRDEVRLARQVSHPNICRVYDIVETEHLGYAHQFIAMEYIDGEDLASLIRRIGRLPGDKATEIARQLCAGVAAAHDQGIIHRDLKPANVMIDGRGRARITDFGIAAAGEFIEGHEATAGTPQYMAPEQLEGREVTKQSDIYSLGLVLYELFCGRKAHDAKTVAELRTMHRAPNTSSTSISTIVPDINPAVEAVIDRCLARDPKNRPASAIAVAAALPGGDPVAAALAAGETPSPEMLAAVGKSSGANPWAMLACLALAASIAIGAMFLAQLTSLTSIADMPRSTDVLTDNARRIIDDLGYDDAPHSAHGWFANGNYLGWVEDNDASPDRWDRLGETSQPPPVIYWYRQHTDRMRPVNAYHEVRTQDPPLTDDGMIILMTDAEGRLHSFDAVPRAQREPLPEGAPADEPDFAGAFALAGLDIEAFSPTDFTTDPRFALDTRHAWAGAFPDAPDVPIIVHIGTVAGRIASFDILEPWNIDDASAPSASAGPDAKQYLLITIITLIILGGALLAWRNVRLGRVDRRGATRAALFIVVMLTLAQILRARTPPFYLDVIFGPNMLVAGPLRDAGFFALFYLAIEPFARRVWPSMLVTWARVTTGKLRDPLVGRDIVVGLLAGSVMVLIITVARELPMFLGRPAAIPVFLDALATRDALAIIFGTLGGSLIGAAAWTLMLVLLRLMLRKKVLAAGAFVALGLVVGPTESAGIGMVLGPLMQFLFMAIVLRFGLFALYVTIASANTLLNLPITTDLSAWHASPTYVAIIVLALVGAYGFSAATAGRSLLLELPSTNH